MTHGLRKSYQAGCHCVSCRAANSQYIAHLRQCHHEGRAPLGALVPAADAARLVRRLLLERYSQRRLAQESGTERHTLQMTSSQLKRLKTVLKVRRSYRRLMIDGPEQPYV